MKISFDINFVIDFPPPPELDTFGFSALVLKQMILTSSANGFQQMLDDMLLQQPQIIQADVIDIKEITDEAYDQDRA